MSLYKEIRNGPIPRSFFHFRAKLQTTLKLLNAVGVKILAVSMSSIPLSSIWAESFVF